MSKHFKYWKVPKTNHDSSTQWSWRLSFWRLEIELFIYRHEYPKYAFKDEAIGDRWVFKPSLIYDRKAKS